MGKQRKEMQRCAGLTIKELEWKDRKNVMRRFAYHLKRMGYWGETLDDAMKYARESDYITVVNSIDYLKERTP